jgi:hypothetical protein
MHKDESRHEWRMENARRIKEALERMGFSSSHGARTNTARAIAEDLTRLTGETVTAGDVYGWIKTGRIHKRHVPGLAEYTGLPQEHFLGSSNAEPAVTSPVDPETQILLKVIPQLQPEARKRMLAALNETQAALKAPKDQPLPAALEMMVRRLQGLSAGELEQITKIVNGVIAAMLPVQSKPRAVSKAYARAAEAMEKAA